MLAPLANPFGADSPIQLGEGQSLEVRSEDQGSGAGKLLFGLKRAGESGWYQLGFEASALIGNSRTLEVPVVSLNR